MPGEYSKVLSNITGRNIIAAYVILILVGGCQSTSTNDIKTETNTESIPTVQEIHPIAIGSPTKGESSEPNLHLSSDGSIYLTWIETSDDTNATLYYSTLNNDVWSTPIQIAEGSNWFVNWADFPSLTTFGDNSLAAHYLVESGPGTYAYDVNISISNDGGDTWSRPLVPHSDNTPTEHGFVSLLPVDDQSFMAVWLDGRKYATDSKEMTLRSAVMDKGGNIIRESVIDERVCDCCPTDAVVAGGNIFTVYRDRSKSEIRDIYFVQAQNGIWTEPVNISNDNWEINGCPVNGPAIDAMGSNVAVAWYTGANKNPKVQVTLSDDLGASFSDPILINESNPIGRVDITYANNGWAYVSWMEEDEKNTYIKVRKVDKTGIMEPAIIVSKTSGERSSGFPKMIKKDNDLLFAWTVVSDKLKIKTAIVPL